MELIGTTIAAAAAGAGAGAITVFVDKGNDDAGAMTTVFVEGGIDLAVVVVGAVVVVSSLPTSLQPSYPLPMAASDGVVVGSELFSMMIDGTVLEEEETIAAVALIVAGTVLLLLLLLLLLSPPRERPPREGALREFSMTLFRLRDTT